MFTDRQQVAVEQFRCKVLLLPPAFPAQTLRKVTTYLGTPNRDTIKNPNCLHNYFIATTLILFLLQDSLYGFPRLFSLLLLLSISVFLLFSFFLLLHFFSCLEILNLCNMPQPTVHM